jgi:hypothetical protein
MPKPMIPKIRGVGEGYPIFILGTSDQGAWQQRPKLYFWDELD